MSNKQNQMKLGLFVRPVGHHVASWRQTASGKPRRSLRSASRSGPSRSGFVGASGSGGNTNIYPTFLAKALGMKFRIIQGYKGTADILLAVERGEVMGMCSDYDPLTRQSLFKEGKLNILFQAGVTKDPHIDAPLPSEFITSETQRSALAFFVSREELGRPFIAPPNVPKERIEALRRAFDATITDGGFIADAKKQRFNVVAMTGEELTALMKRIYDTPTDIVRLTAAALAGN